MLSVNDDDFRDNLLDPLIDDDDDDDEMERKMKRHKSEADISRVRFVMSSSNEQAQPVQQTTSSRRSRGGPLEKTGRWTEEEHTRFLHGLHLFGKKWTKVADIVGTRTTVQVRSHAQKYFQKMEKGKDSAATVQAAPSKKSSKNRSREKSTSFEHQEDDDHTIPVALKRFLPQHQQRANAAELAAGIFKFLSPLTVPNEQPPTWYTSGGAIKDLLLEASEIDWSRDNGGQPLYTAPSTNKQTNANKKKKKPSIETLTLPLNDTIDVSSPKPENTTPTNTFSFSRNSSFDALCSVVQQEHRNSSHDSLPAAADFGLFYDDDDVSSGLLFEPDPEFNKNTSSRIHHSISSPLLSRNTTRQLKRADPSQSVAPSPSAAHMMDNQITL
mmetsp:Transcript_12983/g.19432  ORF Transcript_12983/g.19432 Transcript_12983/m.19432 type:complete len:384 (-) Transcript_12983:1479-2630(-)|eukprot:CAMPEP_0197310932 /NCGR_PEP_ID=MMETSP0891-20130614/9465_1 /TAXON_ID=44058 ORGANISM="Aureoumbra lagunensis, Strain CCMP1510" /NCGR_SAMPLE_ID=MMETSP0891 /ASSEMBLY_ACC=CAM_ASM_000534 /LENGTH=383 /DNA_ID=CAMNT_0042796809 /DNA_START=47 /DNA_END=1198 /DNA_ORIENTATION=-